MQAFKIYDIRAKRPGEVSIAEDHGNHIFYDVAAMFKPTHPHSRAAIRLAQLHARTTRTYITARLNAGDCPRSLYVLACILQASHKVQQSQPRTV